jgi:omega-6 fatty acid desaturase (delta-12 desaturase)
MTPQSGSLPPWFRTLAQYQDRSWSIGVQQIATSVLPYLALMALMIYTVVAEFPYWISLLAVLPAALFLIRTFIIFHDCTHGSFFPSNRANRIVGFITGVLTFTPYEPWRRSHLQHHATTGQLDHRGFGDVRTMTLREYQNASKWQRFIYRGYRHPLVMFVLGSFSIFVVSNRFFGLRGTAAERRSVLATNAALIAIVLAVSLPLGFRTYLATQLPVIVVAGVMGIWLFYVQHQFDPSYWARDDEWDRIDAAVYGSSHYKLPAVLRWFTGNIGIHHLHHLKPRIPNYRLHSAYLDVPAASVVEPLTFWKSLTAVRYNLWSEADRRFLSFSEANKLATTRPCE